MSRAEEMSRGEMMLHQPVHRVIPRLAVPTIISMLITSIYNMADTFFVSQLGTSASGAVGVIFSAMAIIQAVAFMIGMGTGTNVSQALGAGDEERARRFASTGFFTAFIVGVALAALGLMIAGAVGTGVVPRAYFGIPERFSVFASVSFTAVLGVFESRGWKKQESI